jgi:uncharacterized protein YqjF (DUF2071 family)
MNSEAQICMQTPARTIVAKFQVHPLKLPTETERLAVRTRPPGRKPVMYQRWDDLLFLHWSYDPLVIQNSLPRGLTVDTFAGKAYIGIVPFFMRDVRPSFSPRLPGISDFLELNVRTYVFDEDGTPGVWFYSLDANQWLAVRAARRFFFLPYFDSKMKAEKANTTAEIRYLSHRRGTNEDLSSCFQYRPQGKARPAKPGTLEFFLIERYVLFAGSANHARPWSGRVHHQPYPLLDVEVSEWDDAVFELDGLMRPGRAADHVVMSPGVTVEVFGLQK